MQIYNLHFLVRTLSAKHVSHLVVCGRAFKSVSAAALALRAARQYAELLQMLRYYDVCVARSLSTMNYEMAWRV